MSSGCIEANPDIAGIGVRVSIYVQAFMSLVPPIIFLADGVLTHEEMRSVESVSVSILVTACALLVSAFIQVGTLGLSVYHALIVLHLSWINAMNYFVLTMLSAMTNIHDGKTVRNTMYNRLAFISNGVSQLQLLQMVAMSILGIIVWSKISAFGNQPECTPQTLYVLFGQSIPVLDKPLRSASIAMYAITIVPGLNAVPISIAMLGCAIPIMFALRILSMAGITIPVRYQKLVAATPKLSAVAAVIILFVVDTELMIRRNAGLVQAGESQWTFGQTLAMLVLVVPLMDLLSEIRRRCSREQDPFLSSLGEALRGWKGAEGQGETWRKIGDDLTVWIREDGDQREGEKGEGEKKDEEEGRQAHQEPSSLLSFVENFSKEWAKEKGFRGWQKVNDALAGWKSEEEAKRLGKRDDNAGSSRAPKSGE